MPQHHHCCIPGCSREVTAQEKLKGERILYTHFSSPHPKFARNKEDREWRENMMKIVLRYRDPKNTQILKQYHKDQVRVCERHFVEEDIVIKSSGGNGRPHKRLRFGALPLQNLPKKGGQLLPNPYAKRHPNKQRRKPPADRTSKPVVKYKTFANLISAAKRLSLCKNLNWEIMVEENLIKMTKIDEERDQFYFKIWVKEDFRIGISCYSWCLPESHSFCSYDLRIDSLQSFLKHVESWKLCKGVIVPIGVKDADLIPHIVTMKTEPFSSKTASSVILANRLNECEVLINSEEDHCHACGERNKSLVQKWCENQLAMQSPRGQKRPNAFEVEKFIQKHLKYAVKETEIGLQASLGVEKPEVPKEVILPSELDLPSREDWLKPALKYAELMDGCSNVFRMHWDTQASKLYKSVTSCRIEKYVGQHYPKELLEFWSEVYQSGKAAYKRLSHSGLIAIPSCTHISNYIKKKLNNLENTITQVASASSSLEENSSPTDIEVPVVVPSENGSLEEALQQSNLPSAPVLNQVLSPPKEKQIQILFVGDKPGQQRVIPVSLIQPTPGSGTAKKLRIVSIQQPKVRRIAPMTSQITTSSPVQQNAETPSASLIQPNGQITFVPSGQSMQLQQSSVNASITPAEHIDFNISQPDFSTEWGNEVVVATNELPEDL